MSGLLATIATKNVDYAGVTVPAISAYAKKHGYACRVYDDAKGLPHPGFLKFQVIQDFANSEYDHLLYMDADIEIADDTEPPPKTGPNAALMRNDPWVESNFQEFRSWASNWDQDPRRYYNTGVMVWGKEAAKRFATFPRTPRHHHLRYFEQHQFNVGLDNKRIQVGPLDQRWNFFVAKVPELARDKPKNFLHFAHEGKLLLTGRCIIPEPPVDPLPLQAPLAAVVAFTRHDAASVLEMMGWINQIGNGGRFALILLADAKVSPHIRWAAEKIAQQSDAWAEVHSVETAFALPNEKWPNGPNWMFLHAAKFSETRPFYFLEPDCFPLKPGWLQALWTEYQASGKDYMGHVVPQSPDSPWAKGFPTHVTGCAVYKAGCYAELKDYARSAQPAANGQGSIHGLVWPWDTEGAGVMVPKTHHSKQMYHQWGTHDTPPTFVDDAAPKGVGIRLSDIIKGPWQVGHRNKNGEAIRILRKMA